MRFQYVFRVKDNVTIVEMISNMNYLKIETLKYLIGDEEVLQKGLDDEYIKVIGGDLHGIYSIKEYRKLKEIINE